MSRTAPARRAIVALFVFILALSGTLAAGVVWRNASWTPKLALDLAGGTQIVLTPKPTEGGRINEDTVSQAIAIIRQRVDSSGVSEAEITSQGGQNIVVSLPGDPAEQQDAIRLVSQSAQMQFRPVLGIGAPQPATATDPAATDPNASEPAAGEPASPSDSPSPSTNGRAIPRLAATPPADAATPPADPGTAPADPGTAPADAGAAVPDPSQIDPSQLDPSLGAGAGALAGTPSDPALVTPQIVAEFNALDCTNPANLTGGRQAPDDQPLVTCDVDGSAKYILGPVEVQGSHITEATAQMGRNQQGMATGEWEVALAMDKTGTAEQRTMSQRLVSAPAPQNQFGIVLDGLVIMAPVAQAIITDGRSSISGSLTQETANQLASQLRFGALPISFEVQSTEQISATLGSEQLRNGVLAGIIGMLLVVVYMFIQYRALGIVTVASLLVAGILTYVTICLLGWLQGYRLSLPGVTGLIVSIGVTADSFIVYFERVRDELREGRTLVAAVENGWKRARQTIIVSDAINLLASVVLYFLAVGGVRGFAFTLGLTTIMDLIIVVLFTHPMVALLARLRFFSSGHKLSGFDLSRQRATAYAGRGRVRSGPERMTIAERRAAAAAADPAEEPGDGGGEPVRLTKAGSDAGKES